MLNICQPHPMGHGPLRWRHNGHDCVSNHQPHDCLLNCLFRRRSKKTSQLRVTGLCAVNSPGSGEFSAQMASNAEMFPFDDVFMTVGQHPVGVIPKLIRMHLLVLWSSYIFGKGPLSDLISPWTKWPPFRRRYFQVHSCEWKVSYFD